MNDVLKPAIGAILVIVVVAGLMIPYVSEMNDNIVDKNDNPLGSYMLRDANDNNSTVTVEIGSSGIYVNDFDVSTGYKFIIMDTGMVTVYQGSVAIFDLVNNIHTSYNTIGTEIVMKNGVLDYTSGGNQYSLTYENILYPSPKGNYSQYGNNTTINASVGDDVYIVSQAAGTLPKLVATYVDGVKTETLGPFTVSSGTISAYSDTLTYTVPATLSEDGKSWIYSGPRSITTTGSEPTTLTTVFIAPNTYNTVGNMGMVTSLTNLMPLFIGIIGFVAMGIYIVRLRQ